MSDLGLKKQAVAATFGVIFLYAITAVIWFTTAAPSWKKARRRYESEQKVYLKEEKLIGEKVKWETDYETEKSAMPVFDPEKATDTTWLKVVQDLADKNRVGISSIETQDEDSSGVVKELPIKIAKFEGSLQSIVKFMHALEYTDAGMFVVRELRLSPIENKKGYLSGSISITCAYMREKPET